MSGYGETPCTPVGKLTTAPTEVAIGGTTTASAQLTANTRYYMLRADVDCYVLQGTSAITATTGSVRLPADAVLVIPVDGGGRDDYVAVLQVSASGTLQITPLL